MSDTKIADIAEARQLCAELNTVLCRIADAGVQVKVDYRECQVIGKRYEAIRLSLKFTEIKEL